MENHAAQGGMQFDRGMKEKGKEKRNSKQPYEESRPE